MNPALRDIVKEELQKLLDANFIYPISDNHWVSPLVIVPKKDGRWRIFIDYQKLNKSTLKNYFPLPFINQMLNTPSVKSNFHFQMALVGITKSRLHPQIKTKLPLHALVVHFPNECFFSGCVMHLLPFKGLCQLFLLILNVLRFIWMIFLCLETNLMKLLKIQKKCFYVAKRPIFL